MDAAVPTEIDQPDADAPIDGSAATGGATTSADVARQVERRRTIAIIAHADAGKTTLTERLLAETGVIGRAGQVNSKRGSATTTDWMAMERERGISVTSSAVRIDTPSATINLLDTPGHGDFSEDTFRVLSAVDAAIMVLDAAKGIEPQTRALFEVCRARHTPIITFINKFDRPARDPLECLEEVERELDLVACPITWPVGDGDRFRGLIELPSLQRHLLVDGGPEPTDAEWALAEENGELAWEAAGGLDLEGFYAGTHTPVAFGAAVKGWGTADLLRLVEQNAPAPAPLTDVTGAQRAIDAPFSGFVFKLQSNMDPRHRDVSAFVRVASGRFERGMKVTVGRTGSPMICKQAQEPFGRERNTIEEAWPGDVVVLPNSTNLRIGDTLYEPSGRGVRFPMITTFAPEMFARVVNTDTGKRKAYQKGLEQLGGEGVVQLLVDPKVGIQQPVAAAAGELQYEVFTTRMREEFGVDVRLDRLAYGASAQTRDEDLETIAKWHGVAIFERPDGSPLACFSSRFSLDGRRRSDPEIMLSDVLD